MHTKLLLSLMVLSCSATITMAGTYFDQRQHNSFFFNGNWGGGVSSNCYLDNDIPQDESEIPTLSGVCNFELQYAKQPAFYIRLRYEDLQEIQPKLISDIEAYVQDLIENHPPNVFQRVFAFKDQDYEALEDFVGRFQQEQLPYMVLLRRDFQTRDRTPYLFNKGIVEELLKIFESNLEPYRIR